MSEDRLTEIEVALAYDRRMLDDLSQALYEANQEIAALKKKIERLERTLDATVAQVEGVIPDEKPPHY